MRAQGSLEALDAGIPRGSVALPPCLAPCEGPAALGGRASNMDVLGHPGLGFCFYRDQGGFPSLQSFTPNIVFASHFSKQRAHSHVLWTGVLLQEKLLMGTYDEGRTKVLLLNVVRSFANLSPGGLLQ